MAVNIAYNLLSFGLHLWLQDNLCVMSHFKYQQQCLKEDSYNIDYPYYDYTANKEQGEEIEQTDWAVKFTLIKPVIW